MKSKSKSLFYMTVTLLFTLSVCYLSILSPTSAWFYNYSVLDDVFIFGDFDFDLPNPGEYTTDETLKIHATTAFADAGEILFDNAVAVLTIQAKNVGTVPARVYVTYDDEGYSEIGPEHNKGLNYFFVGERTEGSSVSFKQRINRMIMNEGLNMVNYSNQVPTQAYKTQTKGILANYQKYGYIRVEPNSTVYVKIAVWLEHDESSLANAEQYDYATEINTLHTTFTLAATQDTDGAFNVETREVVSSI